MSKVTIDVDRVVWKPSELWLDAPTHYCPGCGHGAANLMLAEIIEDMGLKDRTIAVSSVGCSAYIHKYVDVDWVDPTHGRAPAVATAIKRLHPDRLVFTYQGDGDMASIGAGDVLHAAARGERFTVIMANNANYGMTGGQMSVQSMLGQRTTTTLTGRNAEEHGYPVDWVALLVTMPGVAYVARAAVNTPTNVRRTKRFVRKAFERTLEGRGFSFVEILEMCPSGWHMTSEAAGRWISDVMEPQFPLGEFKDLGTVRAPQVKAPGAEEAGSQEGVGEFVLPELRQQGADRPE